jgi:hypothetical protein
MPAIEMVEGSALATTRCLATPMRGCLRKPGLGAQVNAT